MNETDLFELERELPSLRAVVRLARSLPNIPWFANLGEPVTPGAEAAARTYLDGLGFPDADIAVLIDWDDAAAAAESLDWQGPAWEAEELHRADVTARALTQLSEEALTLAMTLVADKVAVAAKEAMEQSAVIFDVDDAASRTIAVGAAVQAANGAALTMIAAADPEFDADTHPFAAKFQLFEFGRWPVSIIGRTFNLF